MAPAHHTRRIVWATGLILVLIGLYLAPAAAGVALGGSPYYIITGIALIISGALLVAVQSAGTVALCSHSAWYAHLGGVGGRDRFLADSLPVAASWC